MSAPAPLVGFKRTGPTSPMILSALAVSINYRHSERLPASSMPRTFQPLRPCALHIRDDGVDLDLVATRHQQITRGEPRLGNDHDDSSGGAQKLVFESNAQGQAKHRVEPCCSKQKISYVR